VSGTGGPTADNVVAVIVTLQPESDVIHHAEALIGQVVRIVVVDNGSGPGAASILDSISALPSVEVIRNPINAGIARALNQGAQAAMDIGADWLLTLDQDAAPSPEIVRIAGHTFDTYPQPQRIAVIGSTSTAGLAQSTGPASRGRPWIEVSAVITAGSFVSLAAFRSIGGFREDFFVDYVDIEFCLRARARGYRVLVSRAPAMAHRIGQPTERWIGRRAVTPTNHSAVRRYYITRNRLLVWRRYCRTDSRFVAQDILASQRELLKALLFEEDRKSKVRAMLAGIMDGLRGSTGVGWTDPGLHTASTANSSRTRRPL
jgi:rhamnosyltransferase